MGPHILKFVAPAIAKGIAARAAGLAPLQVMACENAINATDILRDASRLVHGTTPPARWRPRPCSPTRPWTGSCPTRRPGQGLDVTVETFYEWVIDRTPFGGPRR